MPHLYSGPIALTLWLYCAGASASDSLSKVIDTNHQGNQAEAETQQEINQLSGSRRALFEEYDALSRELASLSASNAQLQRMLNDQSAQRKSREQTLEKLADTRREIMPLLLAMMHWLEQLTEADLPFRTEARKQAIAELKHTLDRGDLNLGTRYERVLNHYTQAIAEGKQVDVDPGPSPLNPEHMVDFLKVGRLALYYQSPDGQHSGFWDTSRQQWLNLNPAQNAALSRALRIVRKEVPPDLLHLPMQAPGAILQVSAQ